MRTVDEYLVSLRARVGEVRTRVALPAFAGTTTQQWKILLSFLNRAVQIGDGCVLVGGARLGTPLFVLTRVLCEDVFLTFWVSRSPSNAAEYAESVVWEVARVGLANLDKGRAEIVSKTTGKDHAAEILPKIRALKTGRKNVEQLAGELGLGEVYDILYRASSPEVHGKAFGMPSSSEDGGLAAAFSAVIALLRVVGLIADNTVLHGRPTTAEEILEALRIDRLGGRSRR